jgi:hypothetical protein
MASVCAVTASAQEAYLCTPVADGCQFVRRFEVANGLMMGYSADEIACLRRVYLSTVRQQIKASISHLNRSGSPVTV